MSIKLKIGWTDNNAIIEGVRVYKSLAPFDIDSKPGALAEILDGSNFYEDLDVIEGHTYFYMLSCFLGEREVFTECYEVLASTVVFVEFKKVIDCTSIEAIQTSSGIYIGASFPNKDGTVVYVATSTGEFRKYILPNPHDYKGLVTSNYTVISPFGTSASFSSVSFFNNGKKAIVRKRIASSNYMYAIYDLAEAYNIEDCTLIASLSSASFYRFWFSEDGSRLFSLDDKIVTEFSFSISSLTLSVSEKESKTINIPNHNYCQIIIFGSDGKTGIFSDYLSSSYARIVSFKLDVAYDVSTCTQSSLVGVSRPTSIPGGIYMSPGWSNRHIFTDGNKIYAFNTATGSGSNPTFYYDIFQITSEDW